jgi:hypothetical protein
MTDEEILQLAQDMATLHMVHWNEANQEMATKLGAKNINQCIPTALAILTGGILSDYSLSTKCSRNQLMKWFEKACKLYAKKHREFKTKNVH